MRIQEKLLRTAALLTATLLLAATPLWGAVTLKGPTKPVKPNGATVPIRVLFSGETGATATVTATVASDPDTIVTDLTGNNTTVSLKNGKGATKVTFKVAKNPGSLNRNATLEINGISFTVNQTGLPCKVAITPPKSAFEFFGGPGSFNVTAPIGCEWGADEQSPWVTLGNANGSGNGQVAFKVAENEGKNRSDKILVTAIDPNTKNPLATKVHTVVQKEQKLTGTVKIGPLTPLDTPAKAAKAFRSTSLATETIAFLNDGLDLFGSLGLVSGNIKAIPQGNSPLQPVNIALQKLHPVVGQTRKILESSTDIGTELCSSGTAVVDGLQFAPTGELIGISSTVTITFSDCVIENETVNGLITAKGISVNKSNGRISGNIILGQSKDAPLTVTGPEFNLAAFLTLKLAVMALAEPVTVTLQADGFVDETSAGKRILVEMKGVKTAASIADNGPHSFTVDGLVRASNFQGDLFVSSFELLMADFVETLTPAVDPIFGNVKLITVDGMLGLKSTPVDSCIDGTFDISTTETLKRTDGDLVDGTVTINGATISANSDGSKTVTAGGETVIFSPDQLGAICTIP